MNRRSPIFSSERADPFEFVEVDAPSEAAVLSLGDRASILLYTVHDGEIVPRQFLRDAQGRECLDKDVLESAFATERDWGANLVAHALAEALGVRGYGRVRIARVLFDFNRFPGATPPGNREPLDRMAMNHPLCDVLDHSQKMAALDLYDEISRAFEPRLRGKLITLGVHTYDERNPSRTSRPHLSLVTRPVNYQKESRMPYGVFDPMYPDVLAESTASRVLCNRISLNLERAGFRVTDNHPYALPEGSVEVRTQVWSFFSYVRQRFEAEHREAAGDPGYAAVWNMLLNTNLRDSKAESLRGFLHRFRQPLDHERSLFANAQQAYRTIDAFVRETTLVSDYRRSPNRPSSLGLEVRKDLLCSTDPKTGAPRPATEVEQQRARGIAQVVAGAIATYFATDRNAPEAGAPGVDDVAG